MLALLFAIKYWNLVSVTIAAFLLSFLLVGCFSSELTYSLVYLLRLLFNDSADLVSLNLSLPDITLRAGYMAMCVSVDSAMECVAAHNLSVLYASSSIKLEEGTMSLTDVSRGLSETCNPRLLVCCIILSLLLIVLILWLAIPLVPGKMFIRRVTLALGVLTVLLWGLGAMLQHQTVLTAVKLVEMSSLGLIKLNRGGRAEAMTWTAFLFLFVATIGVGFENWKEVQPQVKEQKKYGS